MKNVLVLLVGLALIQAVVPLSSQQTVSNVYGTFTGKKVFQPIPIATLIGSLPPGQPGAPGKDGTTITGVPCAAPGATPPGLAVYAQDPTSGICLAIITVADPGYQASAQPNDPFGQYWRQNSLNAKSPAYPLKTYPQVWHWGHAGAGDTMVLAHQ